MRKIRNLIMIIACILLCGSLLACNNGQTNNNNNNNQPSNGEVQTPNEPSNGPTQDEQPSEGNNESTVDVEKVTLEENAVLEYTGEALAITVKNLPGGVSVKYTYTNEDGEEVAEMVEIGEYTVTAVITDSKSGKELRTLTGKLTIKEREIVDEIPNDLQEKLELTYTTTYKDFVVNPDDATQLIAAGLELYASETIYFLLKGATTPLNFIDFDAENSVEAASLVGNTIVISEAGAYDVIMTFPEDSLMPLITVRAGKDSSEFYFRGTMNDYGTSDEYKFVIDAETNTASYEISLAVGDEFKIGNYYWSVEFPYDPYFTYMPAFSVGGQFLTDVKVNEAGTYKFVIDLQTKTIATYKDEELLVQDRDLLFIRGTMNETAWQSLELQLKKKDGIASIEVEFKVDDIFKISDATWSDSSTYDYSYFKDATDYFASGTENGNVVVKQAGTYKIEVNLAEKTVTVYKDGNKIVDNAGGGNGGSDLTGFITLYFTITNGWENVMYYVWAGSTPVVAWPGQQAEYVETNDFGQKVFKCTVDLSQANMIIFNNGNGGEGNQTHDISLAGVENNTGFYYDGTTLKTYTYNA